MMNIDFDSSFSCALISQKDSPLCSMDDLLNSLNKSTKYDLSPNSEECNTNEVGDVLKGLKMSKRLLKQRISSAKTHIHIKEWTTHTQNRYSRYREFMNDYRDEYYTICSNIRTINNGFDNHTDTRLLMTLVYRTDKLLIKVFKSWNMFI